MATREPPVELFYDPAELDPDAPRLRVSRNGEGWELWDDAGMLVSRHSTQADAIDAALERSKVCFSEILVRGSTGRAEWVVDQHPMWEPFRRAAKRRGRHFDVKNLRFDTAFRLIRRSKWLIPGRERPLELWYDPEKLDPDAPRLRVAKNGSVWELRDNDGALLTCHASLPEALDAALEQAKLCFSEILVRGSSGRMEWSVSQNSDFVELARVLNRPLPAERGAAA